MLTKDDLKQIQKIVEPLAKDLKEVKTRVVSVETRVSKMHQELKLEIKNVVEFLDNEDVSLHKRVTKIENHLGLPSKN